MKTDCEIFMQLKLSIFYTPLDNKQDTAHDNLIIPLSEQCFLVHKNESICLYNTKNNTLVEKNISYKNITFNPIHNTLFCVKEHKENDPISRTLDELTLKDLSPIKTNIPIPFLTPTWLDDDRWLGFSGPWLIIYNHKTRQEETQTDMPVMNVKTLTTYQKNIISVDSGYQTTTLCWDNQTLTEVPESKKEHPLIHITSDMMIADKETNSSIKKTLRMPDDKTVAILTSEEGNCCKIHLMNLSSHEIYSTLTFEHDIEDITALSDGHIIATVNRSFANKEASEKINKEITTSLPSTLRDPSSIINEYVGNQILYPYSLFRPQATIAGAKEENFTANRITNAK